MKGRTKHLLSQDVIRSASDRNSTARSADLAQAVRRKNEMSETDSSKHPPQLNRLRARGRGFSRAPMDESMK